MWREYVRMELRFIESLRRRWDVLGINAGVKGKKKAYEIDADNEGEFDADNGVDGEGSRKDIMEGAIVKSVLISAVQGATALVYDCGAIFDYSSFPRVALPKVELFDSLQTVMVEYPCQPTLREVLLGCLYDLLRKTLPHDPAALKLLANRFLTGGLEGEAFVEGLRRANEEMIQNLSKGDQEGGLEMYVAFVEDWCRAPIDDNLASLDRRTR